DIGRFRFLDMVTETAPDRDNRVTLTDAVDQLGVPKVRLRWKLTELDRRSATRSLEVIAAALGAHGLARIRSRALVEENFWDTVWGCSHHIGTARMHRDPGHGVVDAECRVHGIANLHVAGSAVFPRAGLANPTLTIVALALRLAAYLRAGLR